MGQKISLEEKFALDVVDRLCQKIGRMRGVEQVGRNLQLLSF